MSRGGRGRGRGRGGSSSARDNFNAAFKDMSKEDSRALLESFSKPVKGSGMLYPVSWELTWETNPSHWRNQLNCPA